MKWIPKDKYAWREWFAWFPVNCDGQMVWWETVMRRRDLLSYGNSFMYISLEQYELHIPY